jgi:hypothetical protein
MRTLFQLKHLPLGMRFDVPTSYSFCASLTEFLFAEFSGCLLFLLSKGFQTSLLLNFEFANDNSRGSLAIGNGFQRFPLLLLFLSH